jgi:hypothetical protein
MLSYRGQFTRLNLQKNRQHWPAETNHCAPYKPILLLAVIDLIAEGHIRDNLIEITPELMDEFISVDDDYVLIKSALWSQMTAADLVELKEIARQRLEAYYEDIE